MDDIAITWFPTLNRGDWTVTAGGLTIGQDLQSSVLLSLFTDRVIPSDQIPPDGTTDRRGHWSDTFESSPIGSRLWTLRRKVKSNAAALLQEAQNICAEALQWLIDDGVVKTVDVTCFWASPVQLAIVILLTMPSGPPTTFKFYWAWRGVFDPSQPN